MLRTISIRQRRAVILMVVLVLLTLFAIVGLSFVLYAESQARSAQLSRESESPGSAQDVLSVIGNIDPQILLSYGLNQFLLDGDRQNSVYSATRGWGFARLMYGYNDAPGAANFLPYNGTGRLHGNSVATGTPTIPNLPPGTDDYNLVNYTYYPSDQAVFDPEHTGTRPNPAAPYAPNSIFYGSNAPYTTPDLNNMFLAAVKPDGTVVLQSFHRPWTGFGPIFDPANPSKPNPNWFLTDAANPALKHMVMRPRPVDQLLPGETWDPINNTPVPNRPFFPPPEDAGGDVKNLVGAPGGNDSIWMDLGSPVITAPDGRKFKALYAPLIIDLDNRVDLNAHGNVVGFNRGQPLTAAHASNAGWGPWTVNLGQVLTLPNTTPGQPPTEWTSLFTGTTNTPKLYGRYGIDGFPGTGGGLTNVAGSNGLLAHFYNHFDFDGCDDAGNPTAAFPPNPSFPPVPPIPGPVGSSFSCFPSYPTASSGANAGYGDAWPAPPGMAPPPPPYSLELVNHPSIYNPFLPSGDDRFISLPNMEPLLRTGDAAADSLSSDLLRLCPNSFSDPRIRRMVTLRSMDLDSPGVAPWLWGANAAYQLNPGALYPQGNAIAFPTPVTSPPTAPMDFSSNVDYRSVLAALGRIDLNRSLPAYPQPTGGVITDIPTFMAAQTARQHLARDIFVVLLGAVMGQTEAALPAMPPSPPNSDATYNAARWLAQLAVNIVDFIDTDDYNTPFYWNPNVAGYPAPNTEVVFGTELPRVVINEAYAEFTAGAPTNVSVWVELLNTFTNTDTTLATPPGAGAMPGDAPLHIPAATPYAAYQVALCQPDTAGYLRRADNVWGTPFPIAAEPNLVYPVPTGQNLTYAIVNNWSTATPTYIPTSNTGTGPAGYYLVGPQQIAGAGPTPNCVDAGHMSYQVTPGGTPPPAPTVLLQRLACPYLPPNPPLPTTTSPTAPTPGSAGYDPTKPYNPYITVDYMENVDADPSTGNIWNTAASTNNETAATAGTLSKRQSDGRNHPYSAYSKGVVAANWQKALQTAGSATQPQTTFAGTAAAPNSGPNNQVVTAAGNLSWPVHLDRQLTSPMELLHVSAFKPHEFTQEFINPTGALVPFNHRVPWFDEDLTASPPTASHRLYRLFEFLETASPVAGIPAAITISDNAIPVGPTPVSPHLWPGAATNMSGVSSLTGIPWAIQQGQVLVIDPGLPTQESVTVTTVFPNAFVATFSFAHAAGCAIALTKPPTMVPAVVTSTTPVPASPPMTPTPVPITPIILQPNGTTVTGMNGFQATTGTAWAIKANQVLIVDPGLPTQESVRVLGPQTLPPGPAPTATSFTAYFYQPHAQNFTIVVPVTGNRVEGKINLSSLFDPPYAQAGDPVVFNALCDAQPSNNFSGQPPGMPPVANDVDSIYKTLRGLRMPGDLTAVPPIAAGSPSKNDAPFWGFAMGLYPSAPPTGDTQFANPPDGTGVGFSINNTLLRSVNANGNGTTPRLFQVPFNDPNALPPATPLTTPWVKSELLNKIFNNITTRSNVFAVYMTVGFFEVIDDSAQPVKLGAEIGKSENRNIRRRMLAIVDRTNLMAPTPFTVSPTAISAGQQTVQVGSVSGMVPPAPNPQVPQFLWNLLPNQLVVVDAGTNSQETVVVTAVDPVANTFTATFNKNHTTTPVPISVVVLRGNPGPQANLDLSDPLYAPVVPYFSIIQ